MVNNFIEEFICGRKFQDIANFVIDLDKHPDYSLLNDGDIIWCKTDFVLQLFSKIRYNKGPYYLITHNSDYSIDNLVLGMKPKCIKKWFAQNVNVEDENLVPLPIGLENDIGPSKGAFTDYSFIKKYMGEKEKIADKIYCNITVKNHPSRELIVKNLLEGGEGFIDGMQNYDEYCSRMSKYKYVLSPRGNGIDCHRTWEALYLGSYPIVPNHFMYNTYDGLPIIQTNLESVKISELDEAVKKIGSSEIKYEKLTMSYWKNMILDIVNK